MITVTPQVGGDPDLPTVALRWCGDPPLLEGGAAPVAFREVFLANSAPFRPLRRGRSTGSLPGVCVS